ncbi:MAG TPA: hypothetical protein VGI56_05015, partial [Galbitalea sp.]
GRRLARRPALVALLLAPTSSLASASRVNNRPDHRDRRYCTATGRAVTSRLQHRALAHLKQQFRRRVLEPSTQPQLRDCGSVLAAAA